MLIVGIGERVYETTKLAAVFDVLTNQGCPPDEVLRNVNVSAKDRRRGFRSSN